LTGFNSVTSHFFLSYYIVKSYRFPISVGFLPIKVMFAARTFARTTVAA